MKYVATLLLACAATAASAHAPLPSANWCSDGLTTIAATFDFSEAEIDAYYACVQAGDCPDPTADDSGICGGHLKSCGNFDDDYGKAALLVNAYCSDYADGPVAPRGAKTNAQTTNAPTTTDTGTVAAVVDGPQYFLSPYHHAKYRKSTGVHGVCAKCGPAKPRNLLPDR
jgi:hypothetical protein